MRSEAAIRAHLANIRWALAQPCQCRGTVHEFRCEVGGKLMKSHIEVLEWVLGDNDNMGGIVERLAKGRSEAGGQPR